MKNTTRLRTEKQKENMNPLCHCERSTVMRTSWTNNNPRRRFFTCERREVMNCSPLCFIVAICGLYIVSNNFSLWLLLLKDEMGWGFFHWIDPPLCGRSKDIIPGLLRRVRTTENKNVRLKKKNNKWVMWCAILLTYGFGPAHETKVQWWKWYIFPAQWKNWILTHLWETQILNQTHQTRPTKPSPITH